MHKKLHLSLLSFLALLGAVTLPVSGQDLGLFFDTIDVNVVNIEVVVTDKDGQPVTGLTREDFEVFENGEPVELTNFFPVEQRQAVLDFGDRPDDLDATPSLIEPETKRLHLVVFVDNFNMRPQSRNLIFDNLRGYLESHLDARDQVMIVELNDTVDVVQPFTNDSAALLDKLSRMEKKLGTNVRWDAEYRQFLRELVRAEVYAEGVSFSQGSGQFVASDPVSEFEISVVNASRLADQARSLAERRYRKVTATVDALGQFAGTLAGMPGRKALLYVSDGLPLRPADALAEAWRGKYETWLVQNSGATGIEDAERSWRDLESLNFDTTKDFRELVEFASANKVAFYPISNADTFSNSRLSAAVQGSNIDTGQGPLSSAFVATENMNLEGSLLQMAEGTGGVAFTGSANIDGLLTAITRDFETFYSLGFNSTRADQEEFQKVEVRLKRKDLRVRHFKGHRAKDPLDHLRDLTLSALHYGMVDNPLEVQVAAGEQVQGKGSRYQVPLTLQIPFSKLLLVPEAEFHTGRVSVFVVARDAAGGLSAPQHIELPIQVPNERMLEAITQAVGYPLTLEMEEGPKRISVGVRDNLARIDATLNYEIVVGEAADTGAGAR